MLKKLLDKRATQDGQEADDESLSQPGGLSIPKLGLMAFVIVAVLLGGAALLVQQELAESAEAGHKADNASRGKALAARVSGRLLGYMDVIAAAVRGARADASDNDLAADLQAILPAVTRVRRIHPSTSELEAGQTLGFACIDLAHSAAGGKPPRFETHKFGSPDQHVELAVALPDAAAGAVLVTFDVALLKALVSPLARYAGYVELRQGDGGLMLASAGNGTLQNGLPLVVAPVAGTAWSLAFWPKAAPVGSPASTAVWAVFAAVTAALAVVYLIFTLALHRMVRADLTRLVTHVGNLIVSRRREHAFTVRLLEFREAVLALDEQLQAFPSMGKRWQSQSPKPEPASPEEASPEPQADVMFVDEDSFSLEEVTEDEAVASRDER